MGLGIALPLLLASVLGVQADAHSQKRPGGYMMDFKVIVQGDQGGAPKADVVIARTATQWDKLRAQLGVSDEQNAEYTKLHGVLGAMDWGREQVVFARAKQQMSGGYSLTVQKVTRTSNGWWIDLGLKTPPPDMLTTQALTTPFVVFRTRRVEGEPRLNVLMVRPKQ